MIKKGTKRPPRSKEWCKHLSEGHMGQIAWNKDKKLSEEHKAKLSEAHKKPELIAIAINNLRKWKGQVWNKGLSGYKTKPASEERKKKIGEANRRLDNKLRGKESPHWKGGDERFPLCIDCGKRLSRYNAKRCELCKEKFMVGENGTNWQDGKSFEPYPPTFNQQLKDRIRVRDNFICQKCGIPELEYFRRLDVHHIDYDKKNCQESNLISLCYKCNIKVNTNREYWKNYFQKKMEVYNELFR